MSLWSFAYPQLFPDNWDTHFDILALDLEGISQQPCTEERQNQPQTELPFFPFLMKNSICF